MNSPSRPTRESTTRSSVCPQNGHFTGRPPLSRPPLGIERKTVRQLVNLVARLRLGRRRAEVAEDTLEQLRDPDHLGLAHAARRDGGRAETDPARDHRALRLE